MDYRYIVSDSEASNQWKYDTVQELAAGLARLFKAGFNPLHVEEEITEDDDTDAVVLGLSQEPYPARDRLQR